jgi:glycosyltransferase involved in cell wall biosynthesis
MATYGGIERHVCVLAEEAAKRGHHVRFLTTSNSLNQAARGRLKDYGIDFRELPVAREDATIKRKAIWLAAEVLKARFSTWDLIYTNGQSALAKFVWRAAGRRTRIVHHHHTAADELEQWSWSPAFKKVLATAPEVVGCSDATRTNIEVAVGRKDVRFLPYFTACPVQAEQVKEVRYTSGQPLAFGFVGRLIADKGVDTLCELSRRPELRGVIWHLYGSSPEYPESHFSAFPNVRYHGPYRDLQRYGEILCGLDAIALFSKHNEGMPLSLIEAMSAGLPWIASDRGGTRELAKNAANCQLVANPHSPESVLADTLALIDRIVSGQTSRLAQRAVYDQHFSPAVVSAKWFEFFEQSVASR